MRRSWPPPPSQNSVHVFIICAIGHTEWPLTFQPLSSCHNESLLLLWSNGAVPNLARPYIPDPWTISFHTSQLGHKSKKLFQINPASSRRRRRRHLAWLLVIHGKPASHFHSHIIGQAAVLTTTRIKVPVEKIWRINYINRTGFICRSVFLIPRGLEWGNVQV